MRRFAIWMGAMFLTAVVVQASSIPVDFLFAETPPNTTQVGLPFLLDGNNDVLFLKFRIPNVDQIAAINSITVDVFLADDGDGGGETGEIQFALPGTNVPLASFFPNLNRITTAAPLDLSIPLDPNQVTQAFASLGDGAFRIRISRDTGDFYVTGGTVTVDATLSPEPASLFTGCGALLLLVWKQRGKIGAPGR